jgi:23S rRNA (pseudouridine1915-N3)-methyltransferase
MPIRIIAIGKKHESWIEEGIRRYEKRLKRPFAVSWILLPHSLQNGEGARHEESRRILSKLGSDDYILLLDERGRMLSSSQLASELEQQLHASRPVTIIIGGAYGVDQTVHARADTVWSVSSLVFPHQLVRLLLVEQLYRSQEIARGGSYHHQ